MVNNQPAGKATLAVVIMLDVFILLSIIDGLDEHTNQLTSPQEFIPNYCSEIINGEWVLSHPDELALFMDGGAYRLTTLIPCLAPNLQACFSHADGDLQ